MGEDKLKNNYLTRNVPLDDTERILSLNFFKDEV